MFCFTTMRLSPRYVLLVMILTFLECFCIHSRMSLILHGCKARLRVYEMYRNKRFADVFPKIRGCRLVTENEIHAPHIATHTCHSNQSPITLPLLCLSPPALFHPNRRRNFPVAPSDSNTSGRRIPTPSFLLNSCPYHRNLDLLPMLQWPHSIPPPSSTLELLILSFNLAPPIILH